MPNRIVLLDENTANRIAAGEVVERPASAVKELVENAIDAGATQITVMLEEGGKRLIEVADNGCGMGPEDAVLALQRHATSKITSADDLFAIHSYGFRGEALPSIASVSVLTLVSKDIEEPSGVRVRVRAGEIESVDEVGVRDGTVVTVEDLFHNTPARMKFMKSTPTELTRAVEAVGQLAIARPDIAFRMLHGGQSVLATSGSGDAVAAIAAVWGRENARRLMELGGGTPGLSVRGYVCAPDITRPGRSHELFYVNGRPIRSRLMGHALEDALRAFTPEGRYPLAVVFVDIAPDMVDVNVHPTKTEIKFTRDNDVHHAVSVAVKEAIGRHGLVATVAAGDGGVASGESRVASGPGAYQSAFGGAEFERYARAAVDLFRPDPAATVAEPGLAPASTDPDDPFAFGVSEVPAEKHYADQLRGFRVLGQAANTYIVAVTDNGVAFVDQHTAHERILVERLTAKRAEQGIPTQRLAIPTTLSLGAAEAAMLRTRLDDFAASGWDIEPFGGNAFLVRSAPSYAAKRGHEQMLRDMIDELAHLSVARRLVVERNHVTITNACKMAVKAGDALNIEEMEGLLSQLADTENPYVCPHGRPIVVTVPFTEIERRFKR